MQIIGHRGAGGLAPDNSLEGIRKAKELNVAAIELDVRMQGGTLVLSHDAINRSQVYCPLSQALAEINGKTIVNLEIKEMKAVKPLLKALESYEGDVLLSSFSFKALQKIRELVPEADLAINENWSGVRAVAKASLLEIKRLHLNQKWLWSGFVASLKDQGFSVYAFTVNSPDRAKELREWGVDGIFTDYPNLFK